MTGLMAGLIKQSEMTPVYSYHVSSFNQNQIRSCIAW